MAATLGGAGDSGAPALPPPSHGPRGHLPWLAGATERRRMLGVRVSPLEVYAVARGPWEGTLVVLPTHT